MKHNTENQVFRPVSFCVSVPKNNTTQSAGVIFYLLSAYADNAVNIVLY